MPEFQTAVIPLDESASSLEALPFARALARRFETTLVLVRAVRAASGVVPNFSARERIAAHSDAYSLRCSTTSGSLALGVPVGTASVTP